MMKLGRISSHARRRMKYLGLTENVLERLLQQGSVVHDATGGMKVFAQEPPAPNADSLPGYYAVVAADGEVITVGGGVERRVG